MTRRLLLAGLFASVWAPPTWAAPAAAYDWRLPYTRLPRIGGGSIRIDAIGRPMLLNFWAPWCANCTHEIRALNRIASDIAPDLGAQVVSVAVDSGSPAEIRSFISKEHITYPVTYANLARLSSRYAIRGLPLTLMVDRHGIVRNRLLGVQPKHILVDALKSACAPQRVSSRKLASNR